MWSSLQMSYLGCKNGWNSVSAVAHRCCSSMCIVWSLAMFLAVNVGDCSCSTFCHPVVIWNPTIPSPKIAFAMKVRTWPTSWQRRWWNWMMNTRCRTICSYNVAKVLFIFFLGHVSTGFQNRHEQVCQLSMARVRPPQWWKTRAFVWVRRWSGYKPLGKWETIGDECSRV